MVILHANYISPFEFHLPSTDLENNSSSISTLSRIESINYLLPIISFGFLLVMQYLKGKRGKPRIGRGFGFSY